MTVKIKCTCRATFEIRDGSLHPKVVACPNCGKSLPDNASQDLFASMSSFALFETKLENEGYNDFTLIL